jgi:hypothetical protein
MFKAAILALSAFVLSQLVGIGAGTLLGAILAIDLAQFALVVEHRGRLSTLETKAKFGKE